MSEEEPIQQPKPTREPFGWRFWLFQVVLIAIPVILVIPFVIENKKKADHTSAISNLRGIGFALLEFERDFGSFPSETTARLVANKYPKLGHDLSGGSSNALFRQFFAAELCQSEIMFFAKIPSVRKPDGDISPGKLLEKGEVGFAYIAGLSSKDHLSYPIAFCPIIPGTTRFDPKPFDGYAVFLRPDNSLMSYQIDNDGHVRLGGIDLLSSKNPIWKGKAPDIRYPDL